LIPSSGSATRSARRLALRLGVFLLLCSSLAWGQDTPPGSRAFGIARLKYGGGGDWYEDRTSMTHLLRAVRERRDIQVATL
jgi:hypothetical protein